MHARSKFSLIPTLILALSACGPVQLTNPPADQVPQNDTPSISTTDTAIPLPTTVTPAPPITSLKMINAENGWAWTISNRLLLTSDGGQTWMDRTPEGEVWSNGFFPLDAQTAWLPIFLQDSNRGGLLHTIDGGQTWTEYPYGPASSLHFTDALNGWAEASGAGAGNIYYSLSESKDGGKTWNPIQVKPPIPEEGLPEGTIHLCNICNDSFFYAPAQMIIVHGDMGSMQPGGTIRMQVSFDLGNSWQTLNLSLPQNSSDALVAPYAPVFFGDKDGVLPVSLLKFDSSGSFIYKRLAIYSTEDGGASWNLAPGVLENIVQFTQIRISSVKDIFVVCGNTLCASHDGAQTWQTLKSNLDFTQNDARSAGLLDFLDAATGWASITENENNALYKTSDAGANWTKLTPLIVTSIPAKTIIDTNIPTPTLVPTPTPESTPTPQVVYDPNANATRIRFAPNGTWVELKDTISANIPKRYILSAVQGQIMSVSIPEGLAFSVRVTGVDKKPLDNSSEDHPFWRGALPSTQDYIVTVGSQENSPFTLRIAIDPPGKATQDFEFSEPQYSVAITYTDEFAPTDVQIPVTPKGTPLLSLAFIDPSFFSPRTNLSEAYLLLAASMDPAVVATCTQPATDIPEIITGTVKFGDYTFTRSEFSGAAAGNRYDQAAYRTVWDGKCFEMILLIHSTNIGNYPAGTVVEYDQAALMSKFEAVLNTFRAR